MRTRDLVLVGLFTALIAIGAFIKLPIPYLPLTLQVLFVLMAGLMLGKRLGALSAAVYLLIGLVGVPIFANGGGLGYIAQPSFGYLLSYPVAAYLVGAMIERRSTITPLLAAVAGVVGVAVIYLIGAPYLYLIVTQVLGKALSYQTLVNKYVIAFLPADLVKVAIAAIVVPPVYNRVKR